MKLEKNAMMDCVTIRRYLTLYLDSELGPETTFEISQHLEECPVCQKVFEQESDLESKLQLILSRERDTDSEMWSRVFRRVIRPHRSRFTLTRIAPVVTAAMIILVVAFGDGLLWHHELDLAAATEQAHIEFLEKPLKRFAVSEAAVRASEYFREHLSQSFALADITIPEVEFIGGNLCNVGGIETAHLLYDVRQTPVSVFWLDSKDLDSFPEVKERINVEAPAIHCQVNQDRFYVRLTKKGVFGGIGAINPEQLQELVDHLSAAQSAGESELLPDSEGLQK